MRNPFRRAKADIETIEYAIRLRFRTELSDGNSPLRQMLAKIVRSEAKNAFGTHLGTEIEKFDRVLADRVEQALANLGSAGAAPWPAACPPWGTLSCPMPRKVCSTLRCPDPGSDERSGTFDQHAEQAVALTDAQPTCTPAAPCNLPGHNGVVDPRKAADQMNICPKALIIPDKDSK